MTRIIFSFDTEDFTSQKSADAIKDIADMLREEGLRGCFCLVGLQAQQLINWGRTDVLESLQYHEIDSHSYGHTLHPTINEYTDTPDYSAAYHEFIRQETACNAMVRAATGASRLWATSPAGNNESYVAMYGYPDLGIVCYGAECLVPPARKDMCICNMRYCRYTISFEDIHWTGNADDDGLYDWLASYRTAVIYNHPNMLEYAAFWDSVNYNGENKHPFGEWEEPERLSEEERQKFRLTMRHVLRRLKADGRFIFSTYQEVTETEVDPVRALTPKDMPRIRDALKASFGPLNHPCSLSLADVFHACVHFLRGDKRFHAGRVYGFLEEPEGVRERVILQAEDVRNAAKHIDLETFLPITFTVGSQKIGPADLLMAMLDVLCGEETIQLAPRCQHMNLDEVENLRHPDLAGWCFAPDYTGETLTHRLPLQNWTIRYII